MKLIPCALLLALVQSLAAQTVYEPYHFITIAGSAGNAGTADGVGSAARFNQPEAVVADSSGNVYVADTNNNTVRKITPTVVAGVTTWTVTTLAASNDPAFITVDGSGNVYVTAFQQYEAIQEITPGGAATTLLGPWPSGYTSGTPPMPLIPALSARLDAELEGAVSNSSGIVYYVVKRAPLSVLEPFNEPNPSEVILRGISPTFQVTTVVAGMNIITTNGAPAYNQLNNSTAGGSQDGTGTAALFNQPQSLAVDGNDNIYVADTSNHLIRKMTPDYVVTTIAGVPLSSGSADGTGSAAQFYFPYGVAVDSSGNVYVADTYNNTIRMGYPSHAPVAGNGTASTVLGSAVTFTLPATDSYGDPLTYSIAGTTGGTATLAGNQATFTPNAAGSGTVAFTANNGYASSGTGMITITTILPQPVITLQANSQTVASGHTVVFNASATGSPAPTYQWTLNGSTTIPGAANTTDGILMVTGATSADAGNYVCTATNAVGTATTSATLTVAVTSNPGYLTNLSGRGVVGSGTANGLFGGFGIVGTGPKQLLIRAIGPSLALPPINLAGVLSDPLLTLYNSVPIQINQNDNWSGSSILMAAETAVGAFPAPPASFDSMLYLPLAPASYSAEVSGNGGATGIALIEFYDADPSPPAARLINVSTRAPVGTGNNLLIGGFVIGGTTAETVLIRAVGPSLALPPSNLTGVLAQPTLTLFSGVTPLYSNTVWGDDPVLASAANTVGAYPIPGASQDSLLLVTLPPGGYSAEVTSADGGTGLATVEIYEVP